MTSLISPQQLAGPSSSDWTCEQWLEQIQCYYDADESLLIRELAAQLPATLMSYCSREAAALVAELRRDHELTVFDEFMREYSLDNEEGLILMIMAEALLRIPDKATRDAFIQAEMSQADWEKHLNHSESRWVNLATRGLNASGKLSRMSSRISRLLSGPGKPVIRKAMDKAMAIMGSQFVLGQTITEAVSEGQQSASAQLTHSFDMLGEAALTNSDALNYLDAYSKALEEIALNHSEEYPASLSVKLSALHPRYEESRREAVLEVLGERLAQLVRRARQLNIPLTVDAEEADRLELSLELFSRTLRHEALGWGGLGLAVQAYGKRALPVLGWINRLASDCSTSIPVRLVKGAYWDSEIKLAQQRGQSSYPVYTRKCHTDIAYLTCASYMLKAAGIRPQFATHNAQTISAVAALADACGPDTGFEFQRLHGMGESLYRHWQSRRNDRLRVYAPVGKHKELLPYLVRRLLENGANTSFVHHLWDENVTPEDLTVSPVSLAEQQQFSMNPQTPLPAQILGERLNSTGVNLNITRERQALQAEVERWKTHRWFANPMLAISHFLTLPPQHTISAPWSISHEIGTVQWFNPDDAETVTNAAQAGFERWRLKPRQESIDLRRTWLMALADLLEKHKAELIALCLLEAGKTWQDSVDEVREAVDFCRYYAGCLGAGFAHPIELPGPTGERNQLFYEGRGIWFCISPWNFPLAIFIGQISAAVAAGNAVIAKPAESTSLIAARAVSLAYEAGLPRELLQLVPGNGKQLGEAFLSDNRIAGVAFTGSDITARNINRVLAQRNGPLPCLIAETGGQNAMIADSSALPEQIVRDVMRSAFASAGQRCSALRVLCLQEDIADSVCELLKGAMAELITGDPTLFATDVGPVISTRAQHQLQTHKRWLQSYATLVAKAPSAPEEGTFITPVAYQIGSITELKDEHFGPILHIVRYKASQLDRLIDEINATGFGLTLSIHSRNPQTVDRICQRARVGNVYVNRDQIGAVVGVQPFGGMGRSGTGPKAGGPNYVQRFAVERTLTVNSAAAGGNVELLRGNSDD